MKRGLLVGMGLVLVGGVVTPAVTPVGVDTALAATRAAMPFDFDGDGFADLAVGVPGESLRGVKYAGAVQVLYGSAAGVTARDQLWHQGSKGIKNKLEKRDSFGKALTSGDFDADGYADLAVGIPDENMGSVRDAGAVGIGVVCCVAGVGRRGAEPSLSPSLQGSQADAGKRDVEGAFVRVIAGEVERRALGAQTERSKAHGKCGCAAGSDHGSDGCGDTEVSGIPAINRHGEAGQLPAAEVPDGEGAFNRSPAGSGGREVDAATTTRQEGLGRMCDCDLGRNRIGIESQAVITTCSEE